MSKLLGFSQLSPAYKPNCSTMPLCPNALGMGDADPPVALAPKARNERKSSMKSQKPTPCFNQALGGEGPFHHPPTHPHCQASPCTTQLRRRHPAGSESSTQKLCMSHFGNMPVQFGNKKFSLPLSSVPSPDPLLSPARNTGSAEDKQMHLQFLYWVGYETIFYFPCGRITSKSKEK